MSLRLAVFYFFFLPGFQCIAQSGWQKFGLQSGLNSEEIYGVFHDPKGYLWAFGELNAMRHNGRFFEKVNGFPINGSVGYASTLDRKKLIWIYTSKGNLGCYQSDSFQVLPISIELKKKTLGINSVVFQLLADEKENLYIQSMSHSFLWREKEKRLDTLFSDDFTHLRIQKRNGIWVIAKPRNPKSEPGIARDLFSKVEVTVDGWVGKNRIGFPFPLKTALERTFAIENAHGLWLAITDHIVFIDPLGRIQQKRMPSIIFQMKKLPDGRIWVGTNKNGAFIFSRNIKPDTVLFPQNSISDFCMDSAGNTWISTLESGIYFKPRQSATLVPEIVGEISLIHPTDSTLLVGFGNNKLSLKTKKQWRKVEVPPFINRRYSDVCPVGNSILVGSNSGAFLLDNRFEILDTIRESETQNPALVIDAEPFENGQLWASQRRGIGLIKGNKIHRLTSTESRTGIIKWWQNRLWSATDNGLVCYRWENERLVLESIRFEGLSIKMLRVFKNELWVSISEKGLFKIDVALKALSVNGLQTVDFIYDFLLTGKGELFLGCNKGVLAGRYFEKENRVLLENRLLDSPAFQLAQFENYLYMGTKAGLYCLPLPLAKQGLPKLLLRKLEAGGEELKFADQIKIEPDKNQLSFQFDAIDYGHPNLKLAYILEGPVGFGDVSSSGSIHFPDLPFGDYKLKIRLEDEIGIALPGLWSFRFTVLPHFWETWWFRMVALASLVFTGFMLSWLTVRYYRKKDAESSRLQQMIASYKIAALQSQMNPHFVSNALTAIQNLILTNQTQLANDYLTRFSRMLRMVLDFSDKQFITLENELNVIRINVMLEQLRFTQQFDFELNISSEINTKTIWIPSLITQPFVENAIWHGLLPLENSRMPKLLISIHQQNLQLIVRIEDNGVGRKNRPVSEDGKSSKALAITYERIQNLNLLLGANLCKLEILDLYEAGLPSGTSVIFTFPANLNESSA